MKTGPFQRNKIFHDGSFIFWATIGFFIPVVILAYCNFCIILALQRAKTRKESNVSSVDIHRLCCQYLAAQRNQGNQRTGNQGCGNHGTRRSSSHGDASLQLRHRQRKQTSQWQTTVTLVFIILAFFCLTLPGELFGFFIEFIPDTKWHNTLMICHILQTLNMGLNFGLYTAINSNFRQTIPALYSSISNQFRRLSETLLLNNSVDHEIDSRKSSSVPLVGY